jgi:SH3-like domain-containing protein
MDGQGEPRSNWRFPAALLGAATLLLALCGPATAAERQTPSGYPVPRYVSLKFDEVYARAGPGEDHRLLWVYHVKGLPVQVVAENSEWRRICDPQGGMAWVHKRLTDGRRTVLRTQPGALPLRKKPKPGGEVIAYLNSRAMAALVRCDDGWCKIRVDRVTGWAPASGLWGTSDAVQCRPPARR